MWYEDMHARDCWKNLEAQPRGRSPHQSTEYSRVHRPSLILLQLHARNVVPTGHKCKHTSTAKHLGVMRHVWFRG